MLFIIEWYKRKEVLAKLLIILSAGPLYCVWEDI